MKICNMYVWVILSKPGSNNLQLKVPPSIGIGQQCINAFGYHGNGVATTYFRLATIHCIILCSCVYYCLTHPQPQTSCLCIGRDVTTGATGATAVPKFSDTLTLFQPRGHILTQHRRGRIENFPTVTSLIGIACSHNGWKWTNNSDWLNK